MLEIGDKVTTDFYKKESNVIRTVTSISGGHRSESGYMVNVTDEQERELGADMNWFDLVEETQNENN